MLTVSLLAPVRGRGSAGLGERRRGLLVACGSAGPGERRRGLLVAVLVAAPARERGGGACSSVSSWRRSCVSLLTGIACALLNPLRYAESFVFSLDTSKHNHLSRLVSGAPTPPSRRVFLFQRCAVVQAVSFNECLRNGVPRLPSEAHHGMSTGTNPAIAKTSASIQPSRNRRNTTTWQK